MDCEKGECCKEEVLRDIYAKVNGHSERIVAMEVKLQMILWGVAVVAGLVIANIVATITQAGERINQMHYNQNRNGTLSQEG